MIVLPGGRVEATRRVSRKSRGAIHRGDFPACDPRTIKPPPAGGCAWRTPLEPPDSRRGRERQRAYELQRDFPLRTVAARSTAGGKHHRARTT